MSTSRFYQQLPNDDRLDMRMPAVLKDHADRCARALGESLSEYVISTVARRVSEELPATGVWHLSSEEQSHLMKVLASSAAEAERLTAVRDRAAELFGPIAD